MYVSIVLTVIHNRINLYLEVALLGMIWNSTFKTMLSIRVLNVYDRKRLWNINSSVYTYTSRGKRECKCLDVRKQLQVWSEYSGYRVQSPLVDLTVRHKKSALVIELLHRTRLTVTDVWQADYCAKQSLRDQNGRDIWLPNSHDEGQNISQPKRFTLEREKQDLRGASVFPTTHPNHTLCDNGFEMWQSSLLSATKTETSRPRKSRRCYWWDETQRERESERERERDEERKRERLRERERSQWLHDKTQRERLRETERETERERDHSDSIRAQTQEEGIFPHFTGGSSLSAKFCKTRETSNVLRPRTHTIDASAFDVVDTATQRSTLLAWALFQRLTRASLLPVFVRPAHFNHQGSTPKHSPQPPHQKTLEICSQLIYRDSHPNRPPPPIQKTKNICPLQCQRSTRKDKKTTASSLKCEICPLWIAHIFLSLHHSEMKPQSANHQKHMKFHLAHPFQESAAWPLSNAPPIPILSTARCKSDPVARRHHTQDDSLWFLPGRQQRSVPFAQKK